MDEYVGIPEELRCKRSDGKQWRCSALSMPDKTVCEKHYIQAKRRAANSAQRASERKARRKSLEEGDDMFLHKRNVDPEISRSVSPMNAGGRELGSLNKYKEKVVKGHKAFYTPQKVAGKVFSGHDMPGRTLEELHHQVDESQYGPAYNTPPSGTAARNFSASALGDYSGKSSGSSGEADGLNCHHCRNNDRGNVVWCSSCDSRGYCLSCISRWYADIPLEDLSKVCPACRGICSCRVCLRGDNLIKTKVQEISALGKLRYLHTLLKFVLNVLKQIYQEQCFEMEVETRTYGLKADIAKAKINADEQMCCDFCKIPILDYHRHCTKCSYDLCLTCCRDIRRGSSDSLKGQFTENSTSKRSKDASEEGESAETSGRTPTDGCTIGFSHLFPNWKPISDGCIPCAPTEAGGCGSSKLVLRRIFKINWVAKLVKSAEEIVNGCIVRDSDSSEKCASCTGKLNSESSGMGKLGLHPCSNRAGGRENLLYSPDSLDLKHEGINHFHKHWVKGEPIIVRHVFERTLASSWDPSSIYRGILETLDERMDDNIIVKALDCVNHFEVDIKLCKFIDGYLEGLRCEDGKPEILKLKDWPSPGALEEFISCQRPEFLVNFPLIELIHSKWGILNLAAKLPHDTLQNEIGPKLIISYGTNDELNKGIAVTNLQMNMTDMAGILVTLESILKRRPFKCLKCYIHNGNNTVIGCLQSSLQVYLVMHTAEVSQPLQRYGSEKLETTHKDSEVKKSFDNANLLDQNMHLDENVQTGQALRAHDKLAQGSEKSTLGSVWDVFHRKDVPKLNQYLRIHQDLRSSSQATNSGEEHSLYDRNVYLNQDHKKMLKKEFNVEPWSFEHHIGEAVFIPAGCPFQVRNIQSSVQLALSFVSPESLGESARMAQEIRCLPNDHGAKLEMLEVEKMSLYAASSAIREIEKIVLDPKLSSEIKFEDRNLTAMVAENLERVTKRRQIECS